MSGNGFEFNFYVHLEGHFSIGRTVKNIQLHVEYLHPDLGSNLLNFLKGASLNTDHSCNEEVVNRLLRVFASEKCYLTNSCTDALEMCALILNLKEGDEVIVPSYTYVSTANAFHLRTSQLRFADCLPNRPVVDLQTIEKLVTKKTRAIVVMHYGGIAVDMIPLLQYCHQHNIALIEDAAHAIGACYLGKPLGSFGDFATCSFHYTKPISCGEGGCLLLKGNSYIQLADSVFEKGTNRRAYKELNLSKYEWVSHGSSYTMSALQSCVLSVQLQALEFLISKRKMVWDHYFQLLGSLQQQGHFFLPECPEGNQINGSYFYICLEDPTRRNDLIDFLKKAGIESCFHYLALHRSPFYANAGKQHLPNADYFEAALLRLPIHHELSFEQQEYIASKLAEYFK